MYLLASVVEAQSDIGDFPVHDLEYKFDLAITIVSIAIEVVCLEELKKNRNTFNIWHSTRK